MNTQNKTLNQSIFEGSFAALMLGLGESYLTAYAIFLGATAFEASLVTTLPPLVGAILFLLLIDRIVISPNRNKLLCRLALAQGLIWLPIAGIYYYLGTGQVAVTVLLTLTVLHFGSSAIIGPVWNSLMGDVVPTEIRGAYFGKRSSVVLLMTLLSMLAAGGLLQYFTAQQLTEIGYVTVFIGAFLARGISAVLLGQHQDPGVTAQQNEAFTFSEFLKRSHRSNFLKFTIAVGLFNFSVYVSTPFIAFYLLNDLKLSYLAFTATISISVLSQLLFMRRWGALCDEFGTKSILILSCIGYSVIDILWLFSSNLWFLLLLRTLSGIFWAGFSLSSAAFLFDAVSASKRARCHAYQNVINTSSILLGTLLGGLLLMIIPNVQGFPVALTGSDSPILALFVISSGLRILSLAFLVAFAEVRKVETIDTRKLMFRVISIRPLAGPLISIIPRSQRRDQEQTSDQFDATD